MKDLGKKMKEYWWVILLILVLFAPSWCNGMPHYTGIRGCSTGNNEENNTSGQNKMFFNLKSF